MIRIILVATIYALACGQLAAVESRLGEPLPNDQALVFTTFHEGEEQGLRYAYSYDGLIWQSVPGIFLKPEVGRTRLLRDPSIVRGPDGVFHLVWTTEWKGDQGFGHASSTDLVEWGPQQFVPVMEHEPTTVNVWAPELFFDRHAERFIICWASTIPGRFPDHLEARTNNHRMYYTTTKDFKSWSPTRLFFEPGFSIIDCVIVERENDYVLVLKDNTRPERNLRVAFGETPLGPWTDVSGPFTAKLTEGPTVARFSESWVIYYDAYGSKTYRAAKTPDFRNFTDISDQVTFPDGHKHGTTITIKSQELARLLEAAQ